MAIANVQSTSVDAVSPASPATLAYGSNVVSGNLLIAVVTLFDTPLPVITGITDTVASSWTFVQGETEATNNVRQEVWKATAAASGANTVSVAFTGTCSNMRWGIVEASGMASPAVDKTSKNNSASDSNWTSNATAVTTVADEYVFGALRGGSRTVTPDAAFTTLFDVAAGRLVAGYRIVSATGTYTYSGTYDTASPYTATITTFQAGGAAAGPLISLLQYGRGI